MFKWKKLGRVFNPTTVENKPWLKEFAQAPCTLIFDDFVRVYFSCRPLPDENGQYISNSAYIDLDRKNLFNILDIAEKPVLELGKLGTFDEFGIYPISVIKKDDQIIAYYTGWTRGCSVPIIASIGMAYSNDNGKTFHKYGNGPVLTHNIHDPFVVSGPKIRKFRSNHQMLRFFVSNYQLWYVPVTKWILHDGKPEAVYKIRMAESLDGIEWRRNGQNLIPDKIEENECQASPDVFYHDNRYHMFFCYKYSTNFRRNNRGYKIGYAWSDDMFNWTRDDEQAGIGLSDDGWDSQSIAYPHILQLDGEMYMFYIGNEVGKYGFGIAQLESYIKK